MASATIGLRKANGGLGGLKILVAVSWVVLGEFLILHQGSENRGYMRLLYCSLIDL